MANAGTARLQRSFLPTLFRGPAFQQCLTPRRGVSNGSPRKGVCHDVGVIVSNLLTAEHGFPTRDEVQERKLVTVHQVHGSRVVEAAEAPAEADAVWTAREGVALGVKTADCVPLLLEDPVQKRVAAVHSGWRGTWAEIAPLAVTALGGNPKDLRAAIGPCIRVCCYVVSEELAAQFAGRYGAPVVERREGRPYLNLAKTVRLQLQRAGLSQIDDVGDLCTSCDARFHSYRREKGAPGRQVSFIACAFPRGGAATSL
ncbi:MAG: peptidoglycan editing factor PgeF [Myxococcaceae bacterium]|nr:peptidoglycan editing factor PgeF [Myxococcaceae bacterium]